MTKELEKMMTEIRSLDDEEIRQLDVAAAQRLCGRLDKFLHFLQKELFIIDNKMAEAEVNLAKAKMERAGTKGEQEKIKHLINLTVERMRNVKAFVSQGF